MKAVSVVPLKAGTAELSEVPEPDHDEGSVLVEAVAVGVDGTDQEIIDGQYGEPAPGKDRLVLGQDRKSVV